MNKENAHLYLPLVQALADGKTVQHRDDKGYWYGIGEFSFKDPPDNYRIKPEPMVAYVTVYPVGGGVDFGAAYKKTAAAARNFSANGGGRFVKFIEAEDQS